MNDAIRAAAEQRAADHDVEVDALTVVTSGQRRLVRVSLDADGGVGVDTMARVSRALSAELDERGLMGETPYTLEVTSRGLDQPLETERHWRRNTGRLVDVRLAGGGSIRGHVEDVDADGPSIDLGGERRRVPWDQIDRALVRPELKPRRKDDV